MFCSKCGNKNEDGALFCRNCGSTIETVQANVQPIPPTTPNANKNKNKYLGIGVVVLASILLVFILGGYSNRTPEKAAKSFFKAIYKQNYNEYITLVIRGDVDEHIERYIGSTGKTKNDFKEMIKEKLELINEELEDEYGKNWYKEIKVVEVEEEDGDGDVKVIIEVYDEKLPVYLFEIKGKWYIDDYDTLKSIL